jgi:hypothetical protein
MPISSIAPLDIRIKLAGVWIVVMLIFLLGDVIRIYSGTVKPGEINGTPLTQGMLLIIAVLMVIPIIMVFLSLTLDYQANRIANIVAAIFFFGFNLLGLPTYPGTFDKFLLAISLVFNGLTIWYAWNWTI